MGNGISYPPTNPGSLKALPERLDIHHAKDFAGDRWDKELFDALAIGGTVSREQFLLAPLLDRRMFVEAVRITREDHDEEGDPSWYPLATQAPSFDKDVSTEEKEGAISSSHHFDVEFIRALDAGRPAPTARDPLRLGITLAGLRRHRSEVKNNDMPRKPLDWRPKVTGCSFEGSSYQHQVAVLHDAHDLNGSICETIEAAEQQRSSSEPVDTQCNEVGTANVFVSFWMASDFDEVLDILERYMVTHALDASQTYFWMFDYSMRHHGANLADKMVQDVSTVVRRIGHTVLVIPDDFAKANIFLGDEPPSPRTIEKTPSNFMRTLRLPVMKRLWCAWEAYCSSKTSGGIYRIAGTEVWDEAFRDALLEKRALNFSEVVSVFTTPDVESMHTSRGEDKRAILHTIAEEIPHHGHHVVNDVVKDLLIKELYSRAKSVFETLPSSLPADTANTEGKVTRGTSFLIEHVAHLLHVQGRDEEAATLYEEALATAREQCGDNSETTLRRCHTLGDLKARAGGKLGDGEPLLREALNGRMQLFGAYHTTTLVTRYALAEMLLRNGSLQESEQMHRLILQIRQSQDRTSKAAVQSAEALAKVLKALGRYDDALEVLNYYPQVKAASELTTVVAMVRYERGQISEALALLQGEHKDRKIYLGEEDPRTLQSLNNVAFLLQRGMDDSTAAEVLLRKVLASRRKVLGNDHPDTHNSLFSLADCLKTLDRLDEALPLYREELIGSKKLLGESHPDTKVSLKTMDEVLALTLKRAKHAAHGHEHLEEAERLFKSVISCQRPALGDTHPDTIASVGQLSHVLKKQHKLIEALSYYREVAAYHRAAFGDTHPDTLHHIFGLAELLKHQHHVSGHAHGDGNDLESE